MGWHYTSEARLTENALARPILGFICQGFWLVISTLAAKVSQLVCTFYKDIKVVKDGGAEGFEPSTCP